MNSHKRNADSLEDTPPVRGTGSFLGDRGYPHPGQTKAKFGLACAIRDIVEAKRFSPADVAAITNRSYPHLAMSRSRVSRILQGNVSGFQESELADIRAALENDPSS